MEENVVFSTQDLKTVSSREFRAYATKETYKSSNGRIIHKTKSYEFYKTRNAGKIEIEEWVRFYKAALTREGKEGLFTAVYDYCSKNCAWLRGKKETELYACECIDLGSYKRWEDFALKNDNL